MKLLLPIANAAVEVVIPFDFVMLDAQNITRQIFSIQSVLCADPGNGNNMFKTFGVHFGHL